MYCVYATGDTIYAGTSSGLSISTNGGTSFTTKTAIANGLGDDYVYGVFAAGGVIYAATNGGLSISADGGTSFTNKTTISGLGDNLVYGVFAAGGVIYAATFAGLSISHPFAAVGSDVPIAPMQAYGRGADGKCDSNAPSWVNWSGVADKQYSAWVTSWQWWPNNGTGGYVCVRQPYYTTSNAWAVQ